MKIKDKLFFLIPILIIPILIISCKNKPKIIILATKDAYVSSLYPDINFNGKTEAFTNAGYGTKKSINDNFFITYPTLYLTNSPLDSSAFILGGFDFTKIKNKFNYAYLKFFINYSQDNRKRVPIIIRPLIKEWEEIGINYHSIYSMDSKGDLSYSDIVEKEQRKCKIIHLNITKTDEYKNVIPFKRPAIEVSVDITDIINEMVEKNKKVYGFLVEVMKMENPEYICTNLFNILSDVGVIEVLASENFYWDGEIPSNFTLLNGKWIKVKNKTKGKMKYIPRIELY